MSVTSTVAIIVGVSYDTLLEGDQLDEADKPVGELGLEIWVNMRRFDQPDDVYIGVIFYERPTDAQVEEATKKIEAALPKLLELFGEPSSKIETWLGLSVS